jgi:hypothetical protein
MNVNFGQAQAEYSRTAWQQILGRISDAFARVANWQRIEASVTLNFAAPGAVPGVTDQNVTMDGVEFGDTVLVGCSITTPAGFLPPIGFVSAANVVTVRWVQITGAAANPDAGGATYVVDVWRH